MPGRAVRRAPSIAKLYALRQTQLSEMLKIVKLELIAQTLTTVYLIDVIQAASVFALYIYLSLVSFDAIVQKYFGVSAFMKGVDPATRSAIQPTPNVYFSAAL